MSLDSRTIQTDRLPLKNAAGKLLRYVDAAEAKLWIASGRARAVGTATRIRALVADSIAASDLRSHVQAGARYSHKRETTNNVAGVWTHDESITRHGRQAFGAVLNDCLKPA